MSIEWLLVRCRKAVELLPRMYCLLTTNFESTSAGYPEPSPFDRYRMVSATLGPEMFIRYPAGDKRWGRRMGWLFHRHAQLQPHRQEPASHGVTDMQINTQIPPCYGVQRRGRCNIRPDKPLPLPRPELHMRRCISVASTSLPCSLFSSYVYDHMLPFLRLHWPFVYDPSRPRRLFSRAPKSMHEQLASLAFLYMFVMEVQANLQLLKQAFSKLTSFSG